MSIERGRPARARSRGFTLIEILVGATIGLIGMVIIMQMFALSEARKRTTTTGADAQTNGNIAMYLVSRDLMQAGYGLSQTTVGCTVNTSYGGNTSDPGPFTLAPASITDGGLDANGHALSDSLQVLYSTATMGTIPNTLIQSHAQAATTVSLRTNFGISVSSMMVFWESGKNCTLAQVTAVSSSNQNDVDHATTSQWNSSAIFPAAGYGTSAVVLNLGNMALRTYSVDGTNYNLQLVETTAATGGASTTTVVASEIVNFQAVYGKDTNSDNVVDAWNTTSPGGGTGGATSAAWTQVKLLRVAVVARAGQYERPSTAGGACEATTTANAPSWSPGGVTQIMAVPGGYPSCYRYKVFETVVPIRNMIWG